MAMLASHIQVHDGLLVALSELLLVADRKLTIAETTDLMQPSGLGERVPDVVDLTIDAAEWIGLLHRENDSIIASAALRRLDPTELPTRLPRLVRRGLFEPPGSDREDARGGDLACAIAWFVSQDAWNPPRSFEQVEASAETRLARQFPSGPEFVNKTKWLPTCRWASYLGLGAPDPIEPSCVVPDVTAAVRDELDASGGEVWTAREFVEFIGGRCPVLDGGQVRQGVTELLELSELPWEHDDTILSPSLSMAIVRLEHERVLITEREADAPQSERLSLTVPSAALTIDRVRLVIGQRND
jgi:hypothetical protein